ncbi:unnamed protein product [Penicillium salamii]|nr:unnamed protein product [Penicillium salamii]
MATSSLCQHESSMMDAKMQKEHIEQYGPPDTRDLESNETGSSQALNELQRDLKPRQVFMFSIASSIGTGLVIGTGTALANGGPGSMFLAYAFIGIVVFTVMTGMGEMAAFLPMSKGFGGYATRMFDSALGFACGWNYFFKYIVAAPTNLTAAGLVIQYWRPDLNVAIWVAVFAVVVIAANAMPVRVFGEVEFWAALYKTLVMIIMILACFIIAVGGNPDHRVLGFHYWNSPGAFAEHILTGPKGRFLGWWACVCQACFAFTGTEVVGITFGETPNPQKNVPRAIRQTFFRILLFYILGVLVLGMAVPYNSSELLGATERSTSAGKSHRPTAVQNLSLTVLGASPFVVAINSAGVRGFSGFINASLLVFTLSAACSDIYCSSRSLYGLAKDGQAPKIFARTIGKGRPIFAVAFSAVFSALGFMNASSSSSQVFGYLVDLVTVFAVLNWFCILVSHIAFRRALETQGVSTKLLPYCGLFQPYASYFALVFVILVVIFNGYSAFISQFTLSKFILSYLGSILFVVNYICWKIWKRTRIVPSHEVDLFTGRMRDAEQEVNPELEEHSGLGTQMLAPVRMAFQSISHLKK